MPSRDSEKLMERNAARSTPPCNCFPFVPMGSRNLQFVHLVRRFIMDVLALQIELETLGPEDQNRIAAFLTMLRLKRQGDFEQIEKSLSESDEKEWVSWKDANSELGLED